MLFVIGIIYAHHDVKSGATVADTLVLILTTVSNTYTITHDHLLCAYAYKLVACIPIYIYIYIYIYLVSRYVSGIIIQTLNPIVQLELFGNKCTFMSKIIAVIFYISEL